MSLGCDECVISHCSNAPQVSRRCPGTFNCNTRTVNKTCSPRCVEECSNQPWARCFKDCTLCEGGANLTVLVILPYFLRLVLEWLRNKTLSICADKCQWGPCRKTKIERVLGANAKREALEAEQIKAKRVFTYKNLDTAIAALDLANQRLFNSMDQDNNGWLDANELQNLMLQMGFKPESAAQAMAAIIQSRRASSTASNSSRRRRVNNPVDEPLVTQHGDNDQNADTSCINFPEFQEWCCPQSHWQQAVLANYGDAPLHAVAALIAKFLLWHCLQPILYFLVLYCAYEDGDIDDGLQLFFGVAVAVRELLYLLLTMICVYVHPAFALIDIAASVRPRNDDIERQSSFSSRFLSIDEGYGFLFLYVLAPEMFVCMALFGQGGLNSKQTGSKFLMLFTILDGCGVAALIAGLVKTFILRDGTLPWSLAVGYGATAIGGLFFVARSFLERKCRQRNR